MNKLSTEMAIDVLYTVRAYYASLTAGYPKGKDCRGIGDVMCSEIANSCLMAIKALEQESFINKSCVSNGVCEHDKNKVLDKIRAEIDRQEKWLLQAGCTAYNVDIAFDAIKSAVAESEV